MRCIACRSIFLSVAVLAVVASGLLLAVARPASAAAANPVFTYIEGTAEAPFSLEQPLDPVLTVGAGPDQRSAPGDAGDRRLAS